MSMRKNKTKSKNHKNKQIKSQSVDTPLHDNNINNKKNSKNKKDSGMTEIIPRNPKKRTQFPSLKSPNGKQNIVKHPKKHLKRRKSRIIEETKSISIKRDKLEKI